MGDNNEKVRTLTELEWKLLFNLIPEIEATDKFAELEGGGPQDDGTIQLPDIEPAEVVGDLIDVVIGLDMIPGWNWVDWEEGDDILCDPDQNFSKLKIITLCKLLIMIVKADEFDEGFLVSNFEDGTILKILKALKKKIML